MSAIINPSARYVSSAPLGPFTQQQIKDEPVLFSASFGHALSVGGPITRAALSAVANGVTLSDALDAVVDTRVHMLMSGWYPAIPGWHIDDIPRGPDGQPDLTGDLPVGEGW